MSVAFASVIGISPQETRLLVAEAGHLLVSWNSLQPTFGSMRPHLEAIGANEGDHCPISRCVTAVCAFRSWGPSMLLPQRLARAAWLSRWAWIPSANCLGSRRQLALTLDVSVASVVRAAPGPWAKRQSLATSLQGEEEGEDTCRLSLDPGVRGGPDGPSDCSGCQADSRSPSLTTFHGPLVWSTSSSASGPLGTNPPLSLEVPGRQSLRSPRSHQRTGARRGGTRPRVQPVLVAGPGP